MLSQDPTNIRDAEAITVRTIFNRQKNTNQQLGDGPITSEMVDFLPVPEKDKERLRKFGAKLNQEYRQNCEEIESDVKKASDADFALFVQDLVRDTRREMAKHGSANNLG